MALTRFDKTIIDLEYVYAVTIAKVHEEKHILEIWIFADLPHIKPGEPAVKIFGIEQATKTWTKIIADKKLTEAGGIAYDPSKVVGITVSDDYKSGLMSFRFNELRGATIFLDVLATREILKPFSDSLKKGA